MVGDCRRGPGNEAPHVNGPDAYSLMQYICKCFIYKNLAESFAGCWHGEAPNFPDGAYYVVERILSEVTIWIKWALM